jgi:hypothetical protein
MLDATRSTVSRIMMLDDEGSGKKSRHHSDERSKRGTPYGRSFRMRSSRQLRKSRLLSLPPKHVCCRRGYTAEESPGLAPGLQRASGQDIIWRLAKARYEKATGKIALAEQSELLTELPAVLLYTLWLDLQIATSKVKSLQNS